MQNLRNVNKTGDVRANKRSIEARSRHHCCHGKAVSIAYFECVSVGVLFQHAKRMCRVELSPVSCVAIPCFSHYLINGTSFEKEVAERKLCVLIFCTASV